MDHWYELQQIQYKISINELTWRLLDIMIGLLYVLSLVCCRQERSLSNYKLFGIWEYQKDNVFPITYISYASLGDQTIHELFQRMMIFLAQTPRRLP